MSTPRPGLLIPLAVLALLAGCGPRQLRTPEDAYYVTPQPMLAEELEEARARIKESPEGPEAARYRYLLMRHSFATGKFDVLDRFMKKLEEYPDAAPWLPPATYLKLLVTRETEGALRLLQSVNSALARFPEDAAFQRAAYRLVPPALALCTQSDLETFLATAEDGPVAADVLLALGLMHEGKGDAAEASKTLRRLVVAYPDSPAATEAYPVLMALSRHVPTNPRAIGVILPVSGAGAEYGASVRHGIELAVEDYAAKGDAFDFIVEDSQGDPDRALQALEKLIRERQIVAVFGPLYGTSALVCAAEANSQGVALMTPSALAAGLTRTGPYIFRATLTLEQQARSMAKFAVRTRGFARFGMLVPESAYGRKLSAAFSAEVGAMSATVAITSTYPPDTTDFGKAIVEMGGADIGGYKEAEEDFRRAAQAELEVFLRKFFVAVKAQEGHLWGEAPETEPEDGPPEPEEPTGGEEDTEEALPSTPRVACLLMTDEDFTSELGQRLRAAALPHKTISVLSPESATGFSTYLTRADVRDYGEFSSTEELALAELLSRQMEQRTAPLTVMISVQPSSSTLQTETETLECALAMYDSRTAKQLAIHSFSADRPLPPEGNRYRLDAIYAPAHGRTIMQIVPQLVYHSIGLPILGSDTWNDSALRKRPEAIGLEAFFSVEFWPQLDRPQTLQFTERYQQRYAAPPDALAANAYDAARILMEAALKSDGTREGLRHSLAEFKELDGVSGALRMTPQRETERDAVILQILDGEISPARWF